MFIVPDSLHDAINAKLDAAIAEVPEAAVDREVFYKQLLEHFNEYGAVPNFSIALREQNAVIGRLK